MKGWRAASTLFSFVFLHACASGGGATTTPVVVVKQLAKIDAISAAPGTAVPVDYRLTITNSLDQPVTLTSVELETMGVAGGYQMRHVRHRFDRVIAPRSTDSIDVRAWVQPLQVSQQEEVVTNVIVRGTAQFESASGPLKTGFTARLNQ